MATTRGIHLEHLKCLNSLGWLLSPWQLLLKMHLHLPVSFPAQAFPAQEQHLEAALHELVHTVFVYDIGRALRSIASVEGVAQRCLAAELKKCVFVYGLQAGQRSLPLNPWAPRKDTNASLPRCVHNFAALTVTTTCLVGSSKDTHSRWPSLRSRGFSGRACKEFRMNMACEMDALHKSIRCVWLCLSGFEQGIVH